MKSMTNTAAWAVRLTSTAVVQMSTSRLRCAGRSICDQRDASLPCSLAARNRPLSGKLRRSKATSVRTGTAARYSARQEIPFGGRIVPEKDGRPPAANGGEHRQPAEAETARPHRQLLGDHRPDQHRLHA